MALILSLLAACASKQAKVEVAPVNPEIQAQAQKELLQFQDAIKLIQGENVSEEAQLKAKAMFDALYQSNSAYLGALINSADISFAMEQLDAAKTSYLKVIEQIKEPKHQGKGIESDSEKNRTKGNQSESKKEIEKEIKNSTNLSGEVSKNTLSFLIHSYNQLGLIARNGGHFEEAEAYYQDALKLDKENSSVIKNLAILLDLYRGRLPEALALYEQYQALQGDNDPHVKDWIYDLKNRLPVEDAQ